MDNAVRPSRVEEPVQTAIPGSQGSVFGSLPSVEGDVRVSLPALRSRGEPSAEFSTEDRVQHLVYEVMNLQRELHITRKELQNVSKAVNVAQEDFQRTPHASRI